MKALSRSLKVSTHSEVAFPASYHRLMKQAVKATLSFLPAKVWERFSVLEEPSLSVSIVSPKTMANLNREHRKKDRPTDVLSFPSARTPGSGFIGDVLVCWHIAKRQTKEFGTTPRTEVQRLVVHGVLHLFGFDHEISPLEARRMFSLQNKILKTLEPKPTRG